MMRLFFGRILYILSYPLLALYLSKDHRTRVVIVFNNQVLLVRSWLGNGNWDLPGGGLHKGEDPVAGALREVTEETGIMLNPTQIKLVSREPFRSGLVRYHAHYFSVNLSAKPSLALQKIELIDAHWFNVSEISTVKIHPSLKKIITKSIFT